MTNRITHKEIGSHFAKETINIENYTDELFYCEVSNQDDSYTFSGRSAISLAIKDILVNKEIKIAYVPSYCCNSMLEPFLENNIKLEYYEVVYQENKGMNYIIDTEQKCDVFLGMSYFGINSKMIDSYIKKFSLKNIPVIEDVTHRLFSKPYYSKNADYIVASIRKWLPIPTGGYIRKRKGIIRNRPKNHSNELVSIKLEAMRQKNEYLNGNLMIDKKNFLDKYKKFENLLQEIGDDYKIDRESNEIIKVFDIDKMKNSRKRNAMFLYKNLKNLNKIKLLIPNIDIDKDCPLFVPVIIEEEKRDDLKKYLINKNIYCPVHWPRKDSISSGIEKIELSIICDQRYTIDDMEYILNALHEWEGIS